MQPFRRLRCRRRQMPCDDWASHRWRRPVPLPSFLSALLLALLVRDSWSQYEGFAVPAVSRAQPPPKLQTLKVFGLLPSNKQLQVPFDPTFKGWRSTDQDFLCKLDHAMQYFTVEVDARAPGVLSKLDVDGEPILSRDNLTHVRLAPNGRMVFDIEVTDTTTRRFTLVVQRRGGASLELLGLRPVSVEGQRFDVPFHPSEVQPKFEAVQVFHEDLFVVEYDFADGGQDIQCRIDSQKTIGSDAPSEGQMAMHPHRYVPSLEQLQHLRTHQFYDTHSPGAGPTCRCMVPIDTWRQIEVGLYIRSANGNAHRHMRIRVTRKGCAANTFYHEGACITYCPTFFYPETFNWRCGKCNRHCEFCEHWHHCVRCQRNTTMYSYVIREDGTCTPVRIHAYKVYYDLALYLAVACGVLVALYALVCILCLCRKLVRGEPGVRGTRGESAEPEERRPLTWRYDDHDRPTVGAGGLLRGQRRPAE